MTELIWLLAVRIDREPDAAVRQTTRARAERLRRDVLRLDGPCTATRIEGGWEILRNGSVTRIVQCRAADQEGVAADIANPEITTTLYRPGVSFFGAPANA